MSNSEYFKKYQDKRWQKKRLEIFERDEWTCQNCKSADNDSLHVHHKSYFWNVDPWDYSNEYLITLCQSCHLSETPARKEKESVMKQLFATRLTLMTQQLLLDVLEWDQIEYTIRQLWILGESRSQTLIENYFLEQLASDPGSFELPESYETGGSNG